MSRRFGTKTSGHLLRFWHSLRPWLPDAYPVDWVVCMRTVTNTPLGWCIVCSPCLYSRYNPSKLITIGEFFALCSISIPSYLKGICTTGRNKSCWLLNVIVSIFFFPAYLSISCYLSAWNALAVDQFVENAKDDAHEVEPTSDPAE